MSKYIYYKQDKLQSSNRLDSENIADGSVSNSAFQTLAGINTSSTIESRLTSLTNVVNGLSIDQETIDNLQSIDLSGFANIGNQITALQNFDTSNNLVITAIQSDISDIQTDISDIQTNVSNVQTSVSSNTGRLNVKDIEISTINSTLTTQTSNISTNTTNIGTNASNIGTLQGEMASAQADILTKQDEITSSSKLDSSLVATNVSSTSDTLDNVLQSLRDINDTQSTNIITINESITTLTNSIASNDTELTALQTQDTTHTNQISTINSSLTTINSTLATKQDEITSSSKLDSSLVYDSNELDTLDNIIIRIDGDISGKQDTLNNTTNKLPIDHVDISGSNLLYVDYESSIASKFASLDGEISTLTTLQDGDVANFTSINSSITDISANISSIQTAIANVPYLDNVTSDVQGQIDGLVSSSFPSLTYDSPSTTTTIANNTKVTKIIFDGDSSEQTTAFTSTKDTELSTGTSNILLLQGDMTQAQTDISQNSADILLKQDVIDGSNKLNPSYIDSGTGTMTAQKMEYLSSISEDINTKLTNIDTVLTDQATLNTTTASNITSLTTSKQDVLSSGNKLNPEFIATSGAGVLTSTKMQYLSSITSDLQTQLDSKSSASNTTFTGTTAAETLTISESVTTNAIYETIQSSYTSYASNILTYDYSNGAILYFPLTSDTNFELSLTNVPTTQYGTYSFTLMLGTATNTAYANTIKINGVSQTLIANGGLSNIDITNVTTSGILMQQFTVIWTDSLYKVITNVSEFY